MRICRSIERWHTLIQIGLTGWGDHYSIYPSGLSPRDKLKEYAAHYPIVELDSYFYAIQPEKNNKKWILETPASFRFVIKAYQAMTGHKRENEPFASKNEMFAAYRESIRPYIEAGKLAFVLFQFPPWFDCRKEHIDYLRWCKAKMGGIPCALEFRHNSWFNERFRDQTLKFMEAEGWIHSICDEPQAGERSIPTVLKPIGTKQVLVRFHGRNVHGWNKATAGDNWREVRYLYRYNEAELLEWRDHLLKLQSMVDHVYVVFNNNSGGDASDNAKQMIELLGIQYDDLAAKQLGLF